jgi:hypothetical protein
MFLILTQEQQLFLALKECFPSAMQDSENSQKEMAGPLLTVRSFSTGGLETQGKGVFLPRDEVS